MRSRRHRDPPSITSSSAEPSFDPERIYRALDHHHVDYLVVGGMAAQAYGATRPTTDFDCLAQRNPDNLARLAEAMRDLGARLRVGGLSDAEAKALSVQVDHKMLAAMEVSTWRTEAGDFDVLTDIAARLGAEPDNDGGHFDTF